MTVFAAPSLLDPPCELGNGLYMRRSTPDDEQALADFGKVVHQEPGHTEPDEGVAAWVHDLLRSDHPTFGQGDFLIIEEKATHRIVSSMNLISQTWSYAGIPFRVGRPELVGTAPEYRKRGLVRLQFEVAHRWSSERGELVQAITGIPFFYRQFGYEMAMHLGGGRRGYPADFPALKAGAEEPVRFRPPTAADLPFIVSLDAEAARRSLVYCPRDDALWRYELFGKSEAHVNRLEFLVIESCDGEPLGLVGHGSRLEEGRLPIMYAEVKRGASWLGVTPSLLRLLTARAGMLPSVDSRPFGALAFWLGVEHPLYTVTRERLPHVRRPYAWYLRVPDLVAFVRHIGPALEERLADSVAAGHTGELKLSFFREGLRILLRDGRMASVEPWQPTHEDPGSAGFPGLTFLQLLFGYRTLDELQAAYADCTVSGDDARALVSALFPSQPSCFWPLA